MSRVKRTEITPELKKRIEKMRKKARRYIAKTEVVQFRLDSESYSNLFSIAERERKPIGTLVREWVTEQTKARLTQATSQPTSLATKSENVKMVTLDHIFALQKQIDELKKEIR